MVEFSDRRISVRSILHVAAVNTAIFAGLLLLVEGGLRVLMPIGVRRVVDLRQTIHGVKPFVRYEEFASGLRARSARAVAKPKDTIRILCVGASTTQQMVQETEDTWCAHIERQLQMIPKLNARRIESISAGRSAQKSIDTATRLAELTDQLQPDVVITLLGVNDLVLNGGPDWAPRDARSYKASKRGWNCTSVSALCRAVAQARIGLTAYWQLTTGAAVEWHSAKLPRLQREYSKLAYVERLNREPDPLVEFESSMEVMLTRLQQKGIKAIVLGQPVLWKPDLSDEEAAVLWFGVNTKAGRVRVAPTWLEAEMHRYNAAQAVIAGRHGFGYVDLDRQLPKTLAIYFDDCHFTDAGSAALAELTIPAVQEIVEKISQR